MQAAKRWVSMAVACAVALGVSVGPAGAQAPAPAATTARGAPYAVEYYYKVKWGHFDEFMELYKRNH